MSNATNPAASPRPISVEQLPGFTRSLLRIRVPVVVTLASKRQSLASVLELGPGAIIHFDKLCDQMLELDAAGHPIACGEAVKIGDKFGLRITAMRLPEERFAAVRKAARQARE